MAANWLQPWWQATWQATIIWIWSFFSQKKDCAPKSNLDQKKRHFGIQVHPLLLGAEVAEPGELWVWHNGHSRLLDGYLLVMEVGQCDSVGLIPGKICRQRLADGRWTVHLPEDPQDVMEDLQQSTRHPDQQVKDTHDPIRTQLLHHHWEKYVDHQDEMFSYSSLISICINCT